MNGIWLGIDASTADLALGVWWAGGEARRSERLERQLAALLVPTLDDWWVELRLGEAELHGVVVGAGPGSVTGTRIARAFALGLARARGAVVIDGDSLAARAIAHLAQGSEGEVASLGRRGHAFVRAFARGAERDLTPQGEVEERALADLSPSAHASLRVPPDAAWLAWTAARRGHHG